MSDSTDAKTGQLAATLATWLYLLAESGHTVADPAVRNACFALFNPAPDADVEGLGQLLADTIAASIGADHSAEAVSAWLQTQLGPNAIGSFDTGTREDRLRAARAYQFASSLPWLARILSRFPDGSVGSHWVMVERVTDMVTCADPFPWDDLDEEYQLDTLEFMVKWELAGLTNLHWTSGSESASAN